MHHFLPKGSYSCPVFAFFIVLMFLLKNSAIVILYHFRFSGHGVQTPFINTWIGLNLRDIIPAIKKMISRNQKENPNVNLVFPAFSLLSLVLFSPSVFHLIVTSSVNNLTSYYDLFEVLWALSVTIKAIINKYIKSVCSDHCCECIGLHKNLL